jgi:hypothetical protein
MASTLTKPTSLPIVDPERSTRDAEELADDLRRAIRGEVRFDTGSRALYAADLSMYRQVPIGVVIPRDLNDVVAAVLRAWSRPVPAGSAFETRGGSHAGGRAAGRWRTRLAGVTETGPQNRLK